jgi:hypothetical protein
MADDEELEARALRSQRIIMIVMIVGMLIPLLLGILLDAF